MSTLVTYFVSTFSAYKKGYSCQHVILRLMEYWCWALNNRNAVVATDLAWAFDKMPHALLIAKLNAYGLSEYACNLIISHLRNRKHRVKIMGKHSDWITTNRAVPQWSILGPFYLIFSSMICFTWIWHVKYQIMLMITICTMKTCAMMS